MERKIGKGIPLLMVAMLLAMAVFVWGCSSSHTSRSTVSAGQDSVRNWLLQKKFVFHAINAQPQSGRNITLTTDYTLELRNDSIIAWLPYFGRSFVAPLNPSEGGIKFATGKYTIKQDTLQKKVWKMMFVPQDLPVFENTKDVQQLWLSIGLNGYGTVQVVSVNRSPISFYGYISGK